jgi:class 3 adenylate cyclase/tetratricopeptide (TPR) repeat protein
VIAQMQSPRMIGRDSELARIEEALLATRHGGCRVAVITGEAGVGKSRLVNELRRRAAALGVVVLYGECSEAHVSLPYLPFVEAIGNYVTSGAIDLGRLRSQLGPAAAPLSSLFPELGSARSRLAASDASLDKLRLFEAMVTLLRTISVERGLLLVVEDVHWSDQSSQELLDYLIRRLRDTHTMIIVTHRTLELDRQHPLLPIVQRWRRAGLSETTELRPLSADDVGAMVSAIFDLDATSADLARTLHERTDGVPFAVEELLKEAADEGTVDWNAEHWDPRALAALPAPRSIADNILRRVESLQPDHSDVLRCAAVLGKSFDFTMLVGVAERTADVVLDSMETCVAERFVVTDTQRDNGYRFRHALIREAIYTEMIVSRRRLLHSRAADVIRASTAEAPAELAEQLIAAGRLAEAGPACVAAAEDAMRRFAPREACDLFERAAANTQDPRERGRLLCRLGEAWHQTIDVATAERYLDEGVALLESSGDTMTAAHHRLSLGRCCWDRGDHERARRHYEQARDVLERAGRSEDLAIAYTRLCGLHVYALDGLAAQPLAEQALATATSAGTIETRIVARDWLGASLCLQGRLEEGIEELLGSAAEAESMQLSTQLARILSHALVSLETYGRVAECEPILQRLYALSNDPWVQVVAPYYDGWVRLWAADLSGARIAARSCIDIAERFAMHAQAGWARRLLCVIESEAGRFDVARELLPEYTSALEQQEVVDLALVSLRHHLAAGELDAAGLVAERVSGAVAAMAGTALSDAVAEALLAGGRTQAAARLVEALVDEPRAVMHSGQLLRAQARTMLAAGSPETALESLQAAQATFGRNGYRLEALRTQVLIAQAQAETGDAGAAVAAANDAIAAAQRAGAFAVARSGRALAERFGLPIVAEAEPLVGTAIDIEAVPAATSDAQPGFAGERLVTVLFADIRGFTTMTEQRAPADMAERVAAFQRWAILGVERHHGVVDKFAGDALMATFNVSGAHLDHTQHALDVAVGLIHNTATVELSLGVGIAVGPAIVGQLARGANVTVLGRATNLASRLQAEAKPGEILLSDEAFGRVQNALPDEVVLVDECHLDLKGFESPVRAFRLRVLSSPA